MPRLVTGYDAEVVSCAGGIGAMMAEQNAARQRANAASLAAARASAAAASSAAAADALGVPLHARVMGLPFTHNLAIQRKTALKHHELAMGASKKMLLCLCLHY